MKANNATSNPNGGNECALPTKPANTSGQGELHNRVSPQPGPTKSNLVDTSPRVQTESNVDGMGDRVHNK